MHLRRPQTDSQWAEYYDLRWRVLRAPWDQPRGSERDELEAAANHLAVRDAEGRLLGVGRLHRNSPDEAQIRYMAVEEDCRGQGVGRALIEALEAIARSHGVERVVLNARDAAQGFYERFGYVEIEDGPTKYGTIVHVRMAKVLSRQPIANSQ